MSISSISLDILLEIVAHLSDPVDVQCLRLTCKGFRISIPKFPIKKVRLGPGYYDTGTHPHDFMPFLSDPDYDIIRLVKARTCRDIGNHDVCARCIQAKPTSEFPAVPFAVGGWKMCNGCLVEFAAMLVPGGQGYTQDGLRITVCTCEDHVEESEACHCEGEEGWCCLRCHFDVCNDRGCSGWPGYVVQHWQAIWEEAEIEEGQMGWGDTMAEVAQEFRDKDDNNTTTTN